MKILLLDNYDSFTYNLLHLLEKVCDDSTIEVRRNDKIDVEGVSDFEAIVLSPGPGIPLEAGIMPDVIKRYKSSKPVLGVCLGHQAIAESYGSRLKNLSKVHHGVAANISVVADSKLYRGLPSNFKVGRYHSWAVCGPLSDELKITAFSEDGEIMSFEHKELPVFGIQYHPESILSEYGEQLARNWYLIALSEVQRMK